MAKGITGQAEVFRLDSMDEAPSLSFGEGVALYFSKILRWWRIGRSKRVAAAES